MFYPFFFSFPYFSPMFTVVTVLDSFSNLIWRVAALHKSLCSVSSSQRERNEWNGCHPTVKSNHITPATMREERVKMTITGQLLLLVTHTHTHTLLNTNLPWQQRNVIISFLGKSIPKRKCPNVSGMHIAIMHHKMHHNVALWEFAQQYSVFIAADVRSDHEFCSPVGQF